MDIRRGYSVQLFSSLESSRLKRLTPRVESRQVLDSRKITRLFIYTVFYTVLKATEFDHRSASILIQPEYNETYWLEILISEVEE